MVEAVFTGNGGVVSVSLAIAAIVAVLGYMLCLEVWVHPKRQRAEMARLAIERAEERRRTAEAEAAQAAARGETKMRAWWRHGWPPARPLRRPASEGL